MVRTNYIGMLRANPEYAKLWLAQVISLTGDWFNTVVLSGLVALYSDGSGLAISLFLMARFLPPLLVSPFAGVLLDRFNRKQILVWSNLLRALVVPLFLLASTPDMLWLIYVVTVAQFTFSAVFEPGQSAIIPALVRPDDIVEANTLMSVTWSVMLALGAIIGGVFAFVFGTNAALVADAATFAVAGWLISTVQYDPQRGRKLSKAVDLEPDTMVEEDTSFAEGLRYIRRTPQMAAALFVKFGQSFSNMDTMLTILGTQLFVIGARGELSLGILYSALGLGALIGPMLSNRVNDGSVKRMRRLISIGFVMAIFSWPLLGASTLAIVTIGILIRAMGVSINWTYSNVIIQKSAPDAKLGRMFSIDMAGFQFATIVTTLIHGWLIDMLGIDQLGWLIWGTLVSGLIPMGIWFWIVSQLEKMEAARQHPEPQPTAGD